LGYHCMFNNLKWWKKCYETTRIWSQIPEKIIDLNIALVPPAKLTDPFYD
jgi:hypothetical protein